MLASAKTDAPSSRSVRVIPPTISQKERERRIIELQKVAWSIWESLPIEKKLEINKKMCEE